MKLVSVRSHPCGAGRGIAKYSMSQFARTLRTHSKFPLIFQAGKYLLMFFMLIMIGILSFFYLVKFTEIHTKGYELRKLEIEHDRLLNAQEIQTTQIARQRSLVEVRQSAIASTMIPAAKAVFITQDSAIAQLDRARQR